MVQEVAKIGERKEVESDHGAVLEEELFVGKRDEEDDDDIVLPGFRFHPTDEELVTFYLWRKVVGKRLSIEIITEMDIYKHEPWDFPKTNMAGGDKEWYFFCRRGRKYRNSVRPNRVTGGGFWKATGVDRPIHSSSSSGGGGCIGLKKSLVYYRGSAGKGTKTEWMMHELRLPPRHDDDDAAAARSPPSLQEAEVWTICRIFKRSAAHKKPPQKAAAPQPCSASSVTGSLESDCTGEEYMNCGLLAPPPANGGQNFHCQWNRAAPPGHDLPALYPSVLSPSAPTVDGFWDDIGRMVMELAADPGELYGGRHSCDLGGFNSVLG